MHMRRRWGVLLLAGSLLLTGSAIPLLQTGPLAGRTIVIDPGHGGPRDKGAVGPSGLTEAHVNLQVGLRLATLLRKKGANVVLTRTKDAPLVPDDPKDPTADLRARAAVANEHEADLFLSIHHNDTTSASDPRNDTQVYWKLEDPGPSRDFGAILLPRLAESLHMSREQLIPGNFAVLRHSRRPAILGEGAYMSNPLSESRLKRPQTWQAEAEAYASAVQTYFSRGVPRFGRAWWLDETLRIDLSTDRHPIGDIELWIDDQPVRPEFDPVHGVVSWRPEQPLSNGPHRLRAAARNIPGNAAYPLETTFTVARPAARITARAIPPVWNPAASVHAFVTTTVHDALGQPVADGTPVSFTLGSKQVQAQTRAGQASAFLPWSGDGPAPVAVAAGKAAATVTFAEADDQAHVIFNVSGWGSDVPAASALIGRQTLGQADGEGRLALSVPPGPHDVELRAPGYKPWKWAFAGEPGQMMQLHAQLDAVYDGIFLGKRIVLDPLGADQSDSGKQTLAFARHLQARLAASGAQVTLTRPEGDAPDPADRVRLASRVGADLYLAVAPGSGQAAHYYTSTNGIRLAKLVCDRLDGFRRAPEAGYLLSHTPCPALVLRTPLTKPTAMADGMFDALRQYFTPEKQARKQ